MTTTPNSLLWHSVQWKSIPTQSPLLSHPPPPHLLPTSLHAPILSLPVFSDLSLFQTDSFLRCWNGTASHCVPHKATFFCPFLAWARPIERTITGIWLLFDVAVFLLCFLPDLSFVVFWGISLSRNGQYQPCHTHYKHSNLLINLFWLVLDRLARDWRTLALSESSLTVFYCKSSDIIWPRTKTCFHIWTDDSL